MRCVSVFAIKMVTICLLCFTRRGLDVPQSGGVVEAAPVPDLLGSILSGQSMLLMDSSDVVINRDGSLKATKPSKCVSTDKRAWTPLLLSPPV